MYVQIPVSRVCVMCVRVCSYYTQELQKLSAQSWPSRDHLVVFSDVFDDVSEGSSVFGRILREIKIVFSISSVPTSTFSAVLELGECVSRVVG